MLLIRWPLILLCDDVAVIIEQLIVRQERGGKERMNLFELILWCLFFPMSEKDHCRTSHSQPPALLYTTQLTHTRRRID